MKELDFQAKLVKETRLNDGFGFKIATRHQAGIPDLFLKWPSREGIFVECKKASTSKLEVGLTELQRETLSRFVRAGQPCGWALLQEVSTQKKSVYVGADPKVKYASAGNNCDCIDLTNPWPVDHIVKSMLHWYDKLEGKNV